MFLHHLPTGHDSALLPLLHDIFGRERHRDEREDNGGVGSFMRESRTLYVYYGGASEWGAQRVRGFLNQSFGEWGPIEDISVIPSKCIAFVRYKFRASAEFGKIAMEGQKLRRGSSNTNEMLNVRWANDDPNPTAIARVKREQEEMVGLRNRL